MMLQKVSTPPPMDHQQVAMDVPQAHVLVIMGAVAAEVIQTLANTLIPSS